MLSMTDISYGTSSFVRISFSTMLVFKNLAKNWSSISGSYAAVSLKKMASWLSHSLIEMIPLLMSKMASSTSLKIRTSNYK
tara:strand:- start:1152 stop:1394 length:243 start_codon:yes stop_codon:yes gene_type:complete